MRLKPYEIEAIKEAASSAFGPGTVVRLFGSRVRDDLKGGDIDLIVEVDPGQDSRFNESRFLDHLFTRIDEQKVDVLMLARDKEPDAFARLALSRAVALP